MKILTKILLLLLIASCNSSASKVESNTPPVAILYDLTKIYNQSKSDVEAYLGKPVKIEHKKDKYPCKGSACDKLTFKNDSIEVVFIENAAKWIWIDASASKIPITNAIQRLGFVEQKPKSAAPNGSLIWEINGMELTISVLNNHIESIVAKDSKIQ